MSITLTMTRGNNVSLSLAITLSGSPFDLAGCSLWFTVKEKFTDSDENAIMQKTVDNGITITVPAQGLAVIAILPADTSGLLAVKNILQFDVKLLDSTSKKYTIANGSLVVNPDVTNT